MDLKIWKRALLHSNARTFLSRDFIRLAEEELKIEPTVLYLEDATGR